MGDRAKLLKSGDSQTVELPRKYHFDEDQEEVDVRRQGSRIILEPVKLEPVKRTWSKEFLDLAGSAPDFPYPDEPPPVEPGPDLD